MGPGGLSGDSCDLTITKLNAGSAPNLAMRQRLDRDSPRMLTGQRIRESFGRSRGMKMAYLRKRGRDLGWLAILGVTICCVALDSLSSQCSNGISRRTEVALCRSDCGSARRAGQGPDRDIADGRFGTEIAARVLRATARTSRCQRIRCSTFFSGSQLKRSQSDTSG